MTVSHRNLITKGIFAVSVIAVTAIVGSVGFAQAQSGGRGAGDGYGGTGALVRAAIAKFEAAVATAQDKYNTDVTACLAQVNPDPSNRDDFRHRNDAAVNSFRSFVANPARESEDDTAINRDLATQTDRVVTGLTNNNTQLFANLDRSNNFHNRSALQQCLRTASDTFRASIRSAQQQLVATLHDLLHRRR